MRKIYILIYLLCVGFTSICFSQCEQVIDLNSWTAEGGNSDWNVNPGGTSVTQSINGSPTYFVSNFDFINVKFSGDFTVGASGDNDYVGFVFGYQDPIGTSPNSDYYLFATVKDEPTPHGTGCENYFGYVKGPTADINLWDVYSATPPATMTTYMCDNNIFPGWVNNQTYHFTCDYTSTHIVITIDGTEVVNIQGCFQPGKFGFYNYSQENVTYSNFKYKIISDFEMQSDSICISDTAKYSLFCNPSFQTPYMTTIWDMGDGTQITNEAHPKHVYPSAGVYNVYLKVDDINGCSDSVKKTITVFDPSFDVGPDTSHCINVQNQQTLSVVMSHPDNYLWSTGETTSSITVNQSGTYTVMGQDSLGCKGFDTINIAFNPKPDAGFDFNDTCINQLTYLSDTSVANAPSISNRWWYLDNGGSVYSSNEDTSHIFPSLGQHNVKLIVENSNGCYDTISQQVEIHPYPIPIFTAHDTCLTDAISFQDQSTVNPGSIVARKWYFDNGDSSSLQNPSYTYPTEGIYNVQLIVTSDFGCKDTISKPFTVYPLPNAGFLSKSVCLDSLTEFTDTSIISNAVSSNSITAWNWDFGDGSSATSQDPTHGYATAGYPMVTMTATSNHGCKSSATDTVTVYPKPNVIIDGADLSGCVKVCAELGASSSSVTAPSTIITYDWQLNGDDTLSSNKIDFRPCFASEGGADKSINVFLTLTTNHGCINSDTMMGYINVYHKPIANFKYEPDTPSVLNPIIHFSNQSKYADNYDWNFGDLGNSTFANPTFNFSDKPGTYNVTLISSTVHGCADTTANKVKIIDKQVYYVPNSFTPDGSGINDIFKPVFTYGFDPSDFHLTIFNRWGELVFESRDSERGWDGEYKGQIAPSGTYVWKIEFGERFTSERHRITGHVNLLK